MLPLYLMGYGIFRFFIEFFRRPDNFLGRNDFIGMSRGQTLCMIMVIAGLILFVWEYKKERKQIPNAGVHQSAEK